MGTNTDPYQRCEGKYRLTRGIVEVLGEARNPFSILTKSTLILRDLDVLTEAAQLEALARALVAGESAVQVALRVGHRVVEAGVVSASPIVLHLRPGVKQEYLGWLAEVRPDLLDRYNEIYGRRSYAPKAGLAFLCNGRVLQRNAEELLPIRR